MVQYDKYCLKSTEKPKYVKKKKNTYCLLCEKKTENKNIKRSSIRKSNSASKISVC